jgi:hypothetical protein
MVIRNAVFVYILIFWPSQLFFGFLRSQRGVVPFSVALSAVGHQIYIPETSYP